MAKTMVIVVTDDKEQNERVKNFATGMGCSTHTFSHLEWGRGLMDAQFRAQVSGDVPALTAGTSPVDQGAKILQFPTPQADAGGKVRTMNELESLAIENAIFEYGGNLTEAARALGIGRATLYRKVKQYSIDPMAARRKKAA